VGDGATAVRLVHEFLREQERSLSVAEAR
jgi:hypothetical protein